MTMPTMLCSRPPKSPSSIRIANASLLVTAFKSSRKSRSGRSKSPNVKKSKRSNRRKDDSKTKSPEPGSPSSVMDMPKHHVPDESNSTLALSLLPLSPSREKQPCHSDYSLEAMPIAPLLDAVESSALQEGVNEVTDVLRSSLGMSRRRQLSVDVTHDMSDPPKVGTGTEWQVLPREKFAVPEMEDGRALQCFGNEKGLCPFSIVSFHENLSSSDGQDTTSMSTNDARSIWTYRTILNDERSKHGKYHVSVGAAAHNLATVYLFAGRYELAEAMFERAVQIRTRVLGSVHVDVADSLTKLGIVKMYLKNYHESRMVLKKALQVSSEQWGIRHFTVSLIINHIGCLYFEMGDLRAAQKAFEHSIAIREASITTQEDIDIHYLAIAETLCNRGFVQCKRKNYSEAIVSFSEALDIQARLLGLQHRNVIASYDNLAFAHFKLKEYDEALLYYNAMLKAQYSCSSPVSMEYLQTVMKQSLAYEKQKKYRIALELLWQIVTHHEEMASPDQRFFSKAKDAIIRLEKQVDEK